jgi:hypothetical protein
MLSLCGPVPHRTEGLNFFEFRISPSSYTRGPVMRVFTRIFATVAAASGPFFLPGGSFAKTVAGVFDTSARAAAPSTCWRHVQASFPRNRTVICVWHNLHESGGQAYGYSGSLEIRNDAYIPFTEAPSNAAGVGEPSYFQGVHIKVPLNVNRLAAMADGPGWEYDLTPVTGVNFYRLRPACGITCRNGAMTIVRNHPSEVPPYLMYPGG